MPPVPSLNKPVSQSGRNAEAEDQVVAGTFTDTAPLAEDQPSVGAEKRGVAVLVVQPADPLKEYGAETTGSNLFVRPVTTENNPATEFEAADRPAEAAQIAAEGDTLKGESGPASVRAAPRYALCPRPVYRKRALDRDRSSTVSFDVLIGEDGKVCDLKLQASSGYRILDRAARQSIGSWVFIPAMKNGRTVEGHVIVPFEFVLK